MRRVLISRHIAVCLSLLFVIVACSNEHKTIYHEYQSIAGKGWLKKDTLKFPLLPSDSARVVALTAEVRNTLEYPYADFYLVVQQNIADSLHWQTDTVRFVLADAFGKWKGTGSGNYYQSSAYIRMFKLPPHPKHAIIKVSQGMKDDVLKGITDVGFRLEYR